jgi:hypothetical protein
MDVTRLAVDRAEAERLFRKYKEHRAYSEPIDWEIQRTYQLLAKGRVIIKALESIAAAGVDTDGLPKLAIALASVKFCHLTRWAIGSAEMASTNNWRANRHKWPANTFQFPPHTFPFAWDGKTRRGISEHQGAVPLVPVHVRPKRGLANYHVLWEAEWRPVPPRDPYLLRRIGKADLWLVVAHWDLTEVERAALATRVVS